jgi:hypothetical protein
LGAAFLRDARLIFLRSVLSVIFLVSAKWKPLLPGTDLGVARVGRVRSLW